MKELRDVFAAAAEAEDADTTAKSLAKVKDTELTAALEELAREHETAARSYRLVCVARVRGNSFRSPNMRHGSRHWSARKCRPPRLSQPALETLAIIAYRQPITRAEVEQIRGVNVDAVMQTIMERGFVETVGRADVVGRPPTYGTTALFLEYFGLRGLGDLPAADELRKIVVQKPPAPVTVEPGLATTPPEQLALQPAEGGTKKEETSEKFGN